MNYYNALITHYKLSSRHKSLSGIRIQAKDTSVKKLHYGALDGLRGLSALWVVLGHTLSMTGPHSVMWAPLEHPLLGVDVFIVLSGFLMLSHFRERESAEPWLASTTWIRFWIRRICRIAPLYYAMLLIVLVLRPQLIASWDANRLDLDYIVPSSNSIIQHLTFVFGLLPGSYWSRPLPDWSLSLEMQYYAVFPFIAILWARIGTFYAALSLTVLCVIITHLEPAYFNAFELPSALPAKLHIFVAGMLIADWALSNGQRRHLLPILAVALSFVPMPGSGTAPSMVSRAVLIGLVAGLVWMENGGVSRLLMPVATFLSSRLLGYLGLVSYGVYLAHYPLLMLINASLKYRFPNISGPMHLTVLLATLLPSVYLVAWGGHWLVERPGIQLGRNVLALGRSLRLRVVPQLLKTRP